MNRKNVLGFAMAIAMVAMVAFPGVEVSAAGLTQAQFPELVHYGTITDEDAQILKSFFDFEYYKEQNPDVVEQYGDSYEALFNHFCTKGVFEGRTGSADFDPAAYASAYGDLKAQFGADILSYYRHYATEGKAVGRNITTLAACAEAGITVIGLANDSIVITPEVYRVAVYLGTNDYGAVRQSIAIAQQRAAATGGSVVIVADDAAGDAGGSSDILEKAKAMGAVDTMTVTTSASGLLHILVFKGGTGYAAYNGGTEGTKTGDPIATTTGYASAGEIMFGYIVVQANKVSSLSTYAEFTGTAPESGVVVDASNDGMVCDTPNEVSVETNGDNADYTVSAGDTDFDFKASNDVDANVKSEAKRS